MTTRRLSTIAMLAIALALAMVLVGCSAPPSGVPSSGSSSTPASNAGSASTGSGGSASTPAGSASTGSGGSSTADQAGHAVVTISDFAFSPATVTVKVGAQVVWQNDGKVAHTITFDDGSVSSPDIAPGANAGHKFATAGTFKYHCSKHPTMKGTVVVTK